MTAAAMEDPPTMVQAEWGKAKGKEKGGVGTELEMVFGISSSGSLVTDPVQKDTFYHPIGSSIRCVHGGLKDTTLLQGHSDLVNCIEISPDGEHLASAQEGKETDIILWDMKSYDKKFKLCEHDHGVSSLAFSHDGRLLASVGNQKDNRIYIWDVRTGNYICNASLKGKSIESAVWRGTLDKQTGNYVLVTAGSSGMNVWTVDPYTGTLSILPDCVSGSVKRHFCCVLFNKSNDLFIAGTTSGDICAYVYKTRVLKGVYSVCKGRVTSMTSGSNNVIHVGSMDRTIYKFDTQTFSSVPLVKVESGITSISTERHEGTTYVSTSDCTIWKVSPSLEVERLEDNHSSSILALCSGGKGRVGGWFSSDSSGNLCMWDSLACKMRAKHLVGKDGQCVLSMTMVEDLLICGRSDGCLQMFSINHNHHHSSSAASSSPFESRWELAHAHDAPVTSIAVGHGLMASGSAKGDVKVWEFGSRRLISQRQEHVAAVTGIQIIESGAVVVTCSKDTSCKYFNLRAGISGVFFVMDASRLNSLCVTPDENLLVSVGSDKYLTVWDLAQTETLLSVQAHEAEATCLALSPDSALVVTGGADRVLRLWDVRTGYMLSVLEGHCGRVSCVEFISETKIVSADGNGSVILWDVHI